MTLWGFKRRLMLRFKLLKSCTLFSVQETTAYAGNNYGNMMSTIMYVITYLVFIGALFNKVKTVAGYTYSEILLLTLVTQIGFYLINSISVSNTNLLAKNVKSGDLDLWMTRPVPLLWFVTFQKIDLNSLLVDGLPATMPLVYLLINNFDFGVTPINLFAGLLILSMGLAITHCFQFILNLSCFWTGENSSMRTLAWDLMFFGDAIPFEGYSSNFRKYGAIFIPSIITVALTTSVILGKIDFRVAMPYVFGLMILFGWLNIRIWKLALKHYSSASS